MRFSLSKVTIPQHKKPTFHTILNNVVIKIPVY